mgnify:CR=1 FL=1
MYGLMQEWPLLCHKIIDYAASQHGRREIVSRSVEGPIVRTSYAEARVRALKVAQRLEKDGFTLGDRIATLAEELAKLGAEIEPREDGYRIVGPQRLHGGRVNARGDHRLAMTFAVAALLADGPVEIQGAEIASQSYPRFYDELRRFGWGVTTS